MSCIYLLIFKMMLAILLTTVKSSDFVTPNEGIPAIDTDYLYLYTNKSSIPLDGVGYGVFALKDIPEGEIVCEYRGAAIDEEKYGIFNSRNKYITFTSDGQRLTVVGNTICSIINDPVILNKRQKYTREQMRIFKLPESSEEIIPLYEGLSYNSKPVVNSMGKIFIVTTKFIKANTEIFYSYGRWYWLDVIEKNGLVLEENEE